MTKDLRYAPTHEWVRVDGDTATVGISKFAVESLTDIVHIQLPKLGAPVAAGQSFGEIESVKAVSDLYAPVSGEIVEVNDALPAKLEKLSTDPYGMGWIVKVRLSNPTEVDALLDQAAYDKQCAEESH